MTEIDLQNIEAALGVSILQIHREVLLFELGGDDWHGDAFSADDIIAKNSGFREKGLFDHFTWHDHLLAIGEDPEAGYFFIDLTDDSAWLYFAGIDADPFYQPESYRQYCRVRLYES